MGMIEELKKRIDEVDVVSFDIFDTLIVRLYRKPTDLFAHLEESTGFSGFKQLEYWQSRKPEMMR